MKKIILRISLLLLTTAMLLGAFVGCASDEVTEDTSDVNVSTVAVSDDTDGEEVRYEPAAVDFGGYEYNMLVRTNNNTGVYIHYYEGDMATNAMDIAVYRRQVLLEEQFGIKLNVMAKASAYGDFQVAADAGEYVADAICLFGNQTMQCALNGYLYDINTLSNLNLDASYWEQRMMDEYTIGNSLYCLEGDFNFHDELCTYVILYNETVYKDYQYDSKYGSPYELVSSGKWTLETMNNMITDLASDSDGDGIMNENDHWGLVSEGTGPYYFFRGSGLKTVTNNNGTLTLNIDSDSVWAQVQSVISETVKLAQSKDTLIANQNGAISSSDVWSAASDVFMYNRALFRSTTLTATKHLTDMTSNFGLLPIPKYNEDQTEYYCWVNPNVHYPMAFPKGVENIDRATQIAEIMAYYSRYGSNDTMYDAFYDYMTTVKLCRTADDLKMLELVYESKTYDVDYALGITGITSVIYNAVISDDYSALNSSLSAAKLDAKDKMKQVVNTLIANSAS